MGEMSSFQLLTAKIGTGHRSFKYIFLKYYLLSYINALFSFNHHISSARKPLFYFFWSFICHNCTICVKCVKGKGSPYSITERRVQS